MVPAGDGKIAPFFTVWYKWIGLGEQMSRYRYLIFKILFVFKFFKEVQSLRVLTAKIYLIVNGLRGRGQVLMDPEL